MQRREPTTNSTHIWRRHRDLNSGHIGGRRVLSPLRHPLFQESRYFPKLFIHKSESWQFISCLNLSRNFPPCFNYVLLYPLGRITELYSAQGKFEFNQGHVTINQPIIFHGFPIPREFTCSIPRRGNFCCLSSYKVKTIGRPVIDTTS